jgi:uncharacterized membrane protein HdeD (DUF308 family)
MADRNTLVGSIGSGLDQIHDSWGWFVALGIGLVALGVACIMGDMTATLATVLAFGSLLIIGAVVALVQAFRARDWSGFFLFFLTALLRGFTGYVLIRYPFNGEVGITILLASLFVVGGLFRAVGASTVRFPNWGWTALSGVVSMVLGVWVLTQLPLASQFFIGIVVGVDFIFDGIASITLGTAVRNVPAGRDFVRA